MEHLQENCWGAPFPTLYTIGFPEYASFLSRAHFLSYELVMRKKPRNADAAFLDILSFVDCLVNFGCCSMSALHKLLASSAIK